MKTALLKSIVLLAAGAGLAALASGADFHFPTRPADAGRGLGVEVLPRITITPREASESEPAPQASERCTRFHC